MRARTLALSLAMLLLLSAISGCGGAQSSEPETVEPDVSATEGAAATEEEALTLTDEGSYLALIDIGLERYDLALENGTFTVLYATEGYGTGQWSNGDVTVTVTHRDIDGEWEWTYNDEGVDVNSVTPDPFTDAEKADYLTLAKAMIAAVGEDSSDIAELYTYKATGGVMQGDYSFGDAEKNLRLHIATDAEGRLGYSSMTNTL